MKDLKYIRLIVSDYKAIQKKNAKDIFFSNMQDP